MSVRLTPLFLFALFGFACVPKTQYEDQQAQLQEAKTQLRQLEVETQECDMDTFLQLKEQTQSLDILTQELVDRNTELSSEVSRLRAFETQARSGEFNCNERMEGLKKEYEQRLERTRRTYEDLTAELTQKLKRAEEELAALRRQRAGADSPKPAQP